MKYNWRRGLPLAVLLVDLVALWANMTNNDFVTLDNLRFHLMHLTGHLLDVRLYDWVFDLLQSLPESYSDFNSEELVHQLTEKLENCYCFVLKVNLLLLVCLAFRAIWEHADKHLLTLIFTLSNRRMPCFALSTLPMATRKHML